MLNKRTLPLFIDLQKGGAAIEYIIVSLFAAVVALTSIAYVGKVVKMKVEEMSAKMGMGGEDFDLKVDVF